MVKFKIKSNPVGQYYFPKEIREEFGEVLELIANANAAVVFPEGTPLDLVLKSLEVIRMDLLNRLQIKTKKVKGG